MPRDQNGNFTLGPGNPVISGTIIDVDWANPTLEDIAIALTDSLSRSGSGGMLVPFKFIDGTVTEPGMAFVNEPNTGIYRFGSHDMRVTVNGADAFRFTSTGSYVWDSINMTWVDVYGSSTALGTSYDNSDSGLTATNVKAALDELSYLFSVLIEDTSFQGVWDALNNVPDLTVLTPDDGSYWVVSESGTTDLGGITEWETGDRALYSQGVWTRIKYNDITPVNVEDAATNSVDFFALAEKRIRDNAGSGFAEWGKQVESSAVNQGITAVPTIPNQLWLGIHDSASGQGGVSRTDFPITNINGVKGNISNTNSSFNELNQISFPPAPDATKTYDSASGDVVQHGSAAEAFEGLVTNGDFRDGNTGWLERNTAVLDTSSGAASVTCSGSASGIYQDIPVVSGESYTVAISSLPSPIGSCGFIIYDGANFTTQLHFEGLIISGSRFTVNVTPTQNIIRVFPYTAAVGTFVVDNISLMPTTEQVIISRQDYAFIESWHEAIADKDAVYPLGNVQYGGTDYNGIALGVPAGVPQGYSAFGEFDTATFGNGAVWSTLTNEQQTTFLQDPENNIYFENGQYIQVRYRIRVVEAVSDVWEYINVTPTNQGLLYVKGQGAVTTSTDFDSVNEWSGVDADKGYLQGNNVKIIPIALVQRRNQGAYHAQVNPYGTRYWIDTNEAGQLWYNLIDSSSATLAGAFQIWDEVSPVSTPIAWGAVGFISSTFSGRSDGKFYDAIYASDVHDLRMSSRRLPVSEIREDYKRAAIAGDVLGFDAVPWTVAVVEAGDDPTAPWTVNLSWVTGYGYDDKIKAGMRIRGSELGSSFNYYNSWDVLITAVEPVSGAITVERPVSGCDGIYWVYIPQYHKQANPTFTDIIGTPANIAETFPNGIEGSYIPEPPQDGAISQTYKYNRKYNGGSFSGESTTDNGVSWVSSEGTAGWAFNTTLNSTITSSFTSNTVAIIHYETQAHFTDDDVNSPVVDLGGVSAVADSVIPWGVLLCSSLIGRITTSSNFPLNTQLDNLTVLPESYLLHSGTGSAVNRHESLDLTYSNSTPACKALDYLSSENGQAKLCYAYKEMVWDASQDSPGGSSPITETTGAKSSGVLYQVTNGRFVGYWNWLQYTTAQLTDLDWVEVDGLLYFQNVYDNAPYAKRWSGTGWGDNNQFEITDNRKSADDINGKEISYGSASFKTQFFIDDSDEATS